MLYSTTTKPLLMLHGTKTIFKRKTPFFSLHFQNGIDNEELVYIYFIDGLSWVGFGLDWIEGTADRQTPYIWGEHVAQHYNRENQYFVTVPNEGHVTALNSKNCTKMIIASFLDNGKPDTTCLTVQYPPLDFEGTSELIQHLSKQIFGTSKLWGKQHTDL
jgi:hypothetical protein